MDTGPGRSLPLTTECHCRSALSSLLSRPFQALQRTKELLRHPRWTVLLLSGGRQQRTAHTAATFQALRISCTSVHRVKGCRKHTVQNTSSKHWPWSRNAHAAGVKTAVYTIIGICRVPEMRHYSGDTNIEVLLHYVGQQVLRCEYAYSPHMRSASHQQPPNLFVAAIQARDIFRSWRTLLLATLTLRGMPSQPMH